MDRRVVKKVFNLTEKGNLEALKELVQREKIDLSKCWIDRIPTRKDWTSSVYGKDNEFNLLHMAAATSDFHEHGVDLLKYFIEEHHLDPNMTNCEGDGEDGIPLFEAVHYGSVDAVRYFIDELNMDPQILVDSYTKLTLLHLAAQGGKLATVKYFIEEKKFDPEIKDKYGRTPMYMCLYDIKLTGGSQGGGLDVIKYLAETHKIDLMKLIRGDTMVHIAASEFSSVPGVLKYMIETMKCDPLVKNSKGETPAEYTVRVKRNEKHRVLEYLEEFTKHE